MQNIPKIIDMGLTPPQIVAELNRFIVGQQQAKKAVAIALRNRYRRRQLPEALQQDVVPKNILMIGPTGVGKTEIARRLAKLAGAPFIKVEATKFTEVGYVGRDVESIIRDLVESAVSTQKLIAKKEVKIAAEEVATHKILDSLVGKSASDETREKFRLKLLAGELDNKEVEINVADNAGAGGASFEIPGMPGAAMGVLNISDMIGKALGGKTKLKKMNIAEAMKILTLEESDKLIDHDKVTSHALDLVQNEGLVFLDEIDKITSRSEAKGGEVSREGVQRDLLPLIEGTNVTTKHGIVATDHILFIASGAFHLSKPSDLLPELQGRLPIRVELKALSTEDMVRILSEPEFNLIKQQVALIETEGVKLEFTRDAIEKIATFATEFNRDIEDIGARRLHTILEKLVEEISYEAADKKDSHITINAEFVENQLRNFAKNTDLAKFVL